MRKQLLNKIWNDAALAIKNGELQKAGTLITLYYRILYKAPLKKNN